MSDVWEVDLEPFEEEPAEPDPEEAVRSFAALDAAGRSAQFAFATGAVTDCPLPYLDVQLQNDAGQPLVDVPVKLDFPAGGGAQANSDRGGRAHFPDVDVDATTLDVEITCEWPEGAEEPTYRARVHERVGATPETQEELASGTDEPFLYELPFLDHEELRGEPAPEPDEEDSPPPTVTIGSA